MVISVTKISLWRREVENSPGKMAETLEPLSNAGTNLQIVMGYHIGDMAAIEVFPVSGTRAVNAARQGGLSESGPPSLLVAGENRPGLLHSMSRALADEGINIHFLVAQVVAGRYSAVFGFGSDDDATRAIKIIKAAAGPRRRIPQSRTRRR